jgi:hypothetical protein
MKCDGSKSDGNQCTYNGLIKIGEKNYCRIHAKAHTLVYLRELIDKHPTIYIEQSRNDNKKNKKNGTVEFMNYTSLNIHFKKDFIPVIPEFSFEVSNNDKELKRIGETKMRMDQIYIFMGGRIEICKKYEELLENDSKYIDLVEKIKDGYNIQILIEKMKSGAKMYKMLELEFLDANIEFRFELIVYTMLLRESIGASSLPWY